MYFSPNATGQDILGASLGSAVAVAVAVAVVGAIVLVKYLWRYNFLHDIMCLHVMSSSAGSTETI